MGEEIKYIAIIFSDDGPINGGGENVYTARTIEDMDIIINKALNDPYVKHTLIGAYKIEKEIFYTPASDIHYIRKND